MKANVYLSTLSPYSPRNDEFCRNSGFSVHQDAAGGILLIHVLERDVGIQELEKNTIILVYKRPRHSPIRGTAGSYFT